MTNLIISDIFDLTRRKISCNDKENLEFSALDIIDTNILRLPNLECLQIHSTYFSSFDVNDAWKPGSCSFDINLECKKKWIYMAEPVWHYIQLMFTIEITLVYTFVCFLFLQKKNPSPVTILLSALAVSDSLSNLLTVIPDAIGIHSYPDDMERGQYNVLHWNLPSRMCDMVLILNAFASSFHMISAAITVALCAQKVIVIMFPLKGKIIMNSKCSIGTTLVIFFISHLLRIPEIVALTKNSRRLSDTCCYSFFYTEDNDHIHFRKGFHTTFIVFMCVVIACTTYICCKLTCLRKNLPRNDSSSTKAKYFKSATTVAIICIVFIASEL
ncbi:EBI2 [Mytilus coruscus]|uniref:EBI2 n=1 Tax=Mytilus coruscus TaxID=42192 RepID=A0A6J8A0G7_MYTCO|nr:EBI2 [Mytilus coruscus]